ncbi:unannotated protein [freshwater metagenome]|uniref:Unannotated protein n=1 Tax=freshwater metagenome TaxID=449393 RepID=A0A6J6GVC0_9ZZZZ
MIRLLGASACAGFSTTSTMSKGPSVGDPADGVITPYADTCSIGTRIRPTAPTPVRSHESTSEFNSTASPIISSGNNTANGSSPTASRAHPTAWPSPRGASWYTTVTFTSRPTRANLSARSPRPLARTFSITAGDGATYASTGVFDTCDTTTMWSMPAPTASSITSCRAGTSTIGSNSFGTALVTG